MVADFKSFSKTNITNTSKSMMIVLYSHKVVAWWQILNNSQKQTTNTSNTIMIVLQSYKVVAWWQI